MLRKFPRSPDSFLQCFVNLALHQSEEQPNTELFLRVVPFYITLLIGWGKEDNCEWRGGGKSVFNNRENGFSYFIYVIIIISI